MASWTIRAADATPITGVPSRVIECQFLLSEAELLELDAARNPAGMLLRLDTIDAMIADPDAAGAIATVARAFITAAMAPSPDDQHEVREAMPWEGLPWAILDEVEGIDRPTAQQEEETFSDPDPTGRCWCSDPTCTWRTPAEDQR